MKRVVLVYGALYHGGIETQIIRLANYLVGQGREVGVCVSGDELGTYFDKNVDMLSWRNRRHAVSLASEWMNSSQTPAIILSFDPISAALGLAIECRVPNLAPVHLCGIYHTHTFFMKGERPDRILLNELVAGAVGYDHLFFMNTECRDSHASRWRIDLESSPIIPLSVDEQHASWVPLHQSGLRVVSVGRLVEFKGYNLAAAGIARECEAAGLDISWDIYGHGPLESAVLKSIEDAGMKDRVRFLGTLPYSDFGKTVAAHDLFVGMGTAALEAAMTGAPTLVATGSEFRRTFGYMDELPFGNVGEPQGCPPPYDLGERIQAFGALDNEERRKIGLRCHAAVQDYTPASLVNAIDLMAESAARGPSRLRKKSISMLYEAAVDSAAARTARTLKGALNSRTPKARQIRP